MMAFLSALAIGLAASMGADQSLKASTDWLPQDAAHLLRRAGFGGTPEQIKFLTDLGRKKAVDYLVDFEKVPADLAPLDPAPEPVRYARAKRMRQADMQSEGMKPDKQAISEIRRTDGVQLRRIVIWWIQQMTATPRPLQEKMVLFWHGHFTSGYREVKSSYALYLQNQLFRKEAVGNFRDLLLEVTRDPAMILYLNTQQNVKQKPNENYARELMELFTLGVGHYTEKDIKEGARALTGIRIDPRSATVVQARRQHDDGQKTFLGRTGNLGPGDVIDQILKQPACAEFMARKLWSYFAYENPDPKLVKALAARLRGSNYNIREALRAMFMSDAFYSERAQWTHIKSPVELLVGTMRVLETAPVDGNTMLELLKAMGQELMQPPNVRGWLGGSLWINTSTLFNRYNALSLVIFGNDNDAFRRQRERMRQQFEATFGAESPILEQMSGGVMDRPQPAYEPNAVLKDKGIDSPEKLVDYYLGRMLQRPIEKERRQELIDTVSEQLKAKSIDDPKNAAGIRQLIHLIVSLPEFQLS